MSSGNTLPFLFSQRNGKCPGADPKAPGMVQAPVTVPTETHKPPQKNPTKKQKKPTTPKKSPPTTPPKKKKNPANPQKPNTQTEKNQPHQKKTPKPKNPPRPPPHQPPNPPRTLYSRHKRKWRTGTAKSAARTPDARCTRKGCLGNMEENPLRNWRKKSRWRKNI